MVMGWRGGRLFPTAGNPVGNDRRRRDVSQTSAGDCGLLVLRFKNGLVGISHQVTVSVPAGYAIPTLPRARRTSNRESSECVSERSSSK